MNEGKYQQQLKKKIKKLLPGSIVLKNDPNWLQGFPDLTVLYRDRYAVLEAKRAEDAPCRPNQEYYIDKLGSWAVYSAFISPENEEVVLRELQHSLEAGR